MRTRVRGSRAALRVGVHGRAGLSPAQGTGVAVVGRARDAIRRGPDLRGRAAAGRGNLVDDLRRRAARIADRARDAGKPRCAAGGGARAGGARVSTHLRGGRWEEVFTAGFDASWELDVFGGIRREVQSADASFEATETDRDATLVTLFGDVGFQYVTYRSLQRRIAIANDNLRTQVATLELTHELFVAGISPEFDVQRAAAQAATTASTIPTLEFQAAQSMQLGVLLGLPPMALRAELAPVVPIPRAPAQVAVGLPSELLLRRPEIARSERQLAAATAEIGVAPQISSRASS